jgi:hypothetical protein
VVVVDAAVAVVVPKAVVQIRCAPVTVAFAERRGNLSTQRQMASSAPQKADLGPLFFEGSLAAHPEWHKACRHPHRQSGRRHT